MEILGKQYLKNNAQLTEKIFSKNFYAATLPCKINVCYDTAYQ